MLRIKEKPEDFYVKEIKNLDLKDSGEYAYFLLKKRNRTTVDAVREVAELLKVSLKDVGFAGLKDKKAVTEQYISVRSPRDIREVERENLSLKFLGYGEKPITLGDIEGNYFEITLRQVPEKKYRRAERMLEFISKFGFENYFGEQRFGSAKHADEFIVKHLLRHDYEKAMKEYLTSMKDRERRKLLKRLWRRWDQFLEVMPQGSQMELQVVRALKRGTSFKKAFMILPKNVRLMFAFAYQSYLWNRILSTFVIRYFKHCKVNFLKWTLAFTTSIEERVFDEIKDMEIPFLGVECRPPSRKVEMIMREVFEEEGISKSKLEAHRIGIKLFTDGKRRAFVFPERLKLLREGKKVRVSFILPPGSYATVLLRKLFCSDLETSA